MSDIHVLVVADTNESADHLANNLLPDAGYQTTIADNFTPPPDGVDVMVVDVTKLRSSPFALLKAQRRMGCTARALLLAPRLTDEMALEMFELGIRDYLKTPVDDLMLIDKMGTFASFILQEQTQAQARQHLARTQDILKRRLEEMNALSRVGRSISATNDIDVILERIVEAAAYLSYADSSALYMVDEEGLPVLHVHQGLTDEQATAIYRPSRDSDVMMVLQSGDPVLKSGDVQSKITTSHLVRALINAPIIVDNQVQGVLAVYRYGGGNFEEADKTTLVTLADYAAIALSKVNTLNTIAGQVDLALDASRTVMKHATTMDAPIDGIESLADTLLAGGFDPLSEAQSTAVSRIKLATVRLHEIFGFIRATIQEFENQFRDSM